MPFKCSFKFDQIVGDRTGGGSINLWWNGNSLDVLVQPNATTQSPGKCKDMRSKIEGVIGNQTGIKSVRVSQDGAFRVTRKQPFEPLNPFPSQFDSDYVTTALAIILTGDGGQQTRQWLRGVPDEIIKKGVFVPFPDWTTKFNAFKAELTSTSNSWSIRILDPAIGYLPVTGLTEAGVVTVVGHPYVVGDQVRLSRVKVPSEVNGIYRVAAKTTDTVTLANFLPPSPFVVNLGQSARMRKLSYIYRRVINVEVERATSHDTGRPSGLLGGRRKKRKT